MLAGKRFLLVVALAAAALVGWPEATPAVGLHCRGIDDGTLCVPLPHGWFGSVGFGIAAGRPAAWILAADFPLQSNTASHEGTPPVPARKVLISVGDFPVTRWSAHPRRVRQLRLPAEASRVIRWRVRFGGRLLFLEAHLGRGASRAPVSARLAAIYRIRRP